VTETAVVEQGAAGNRARAELKILHEQGVRIAIDDFGTGFSSLGQLRHFPIDMIKVDYTFVQALSTTPKDAAITANLVNLAHALGLVAVAEGSSLKGSWRHSRASGCDLGRISVRAADARRPTERPPRERCAAVRARRGGRLTSSTPGVPSPDGTVARAEPALVVADEPRCDISSAEPRIRHDEADRKRLVYGWSDFS